MIKTVFVPLIVKAHREIPATWDSAQVKLNLAMNDALADLDMALDDGWRIIAQQWIDSGYDAGTVFFLRDDSECLLITDEGLEALDEAQEPLIPVNADSAMIGADF